MSLKLKFEVARGMKACFRCRVFPQVLSAKNILVFRTNFWGMERDKDTRKSHTIQIFREESF